MKSFSRLILRYAGAVALIGTLLAGVGLKYSIKLYSNLRTDIEELLPSDARAVTDLAEVTRRLESIDNLGILIFSQDAKAGKRFQIDLAEALKRYPKTTISSIEYRIDKELRFFKAREALYMDLSDLEKIKEYIGARIDYEKELYNPLNIFAERDLPEPMLDFEAMRKKYNTKAGSYDRFPEGFYATPDGKKRVVLAYMPGKTSSIDQVHALKRAAEATIARLDPKSYAPDLEVKYTGGVQDTLEEHEALIEDLELSTVIVTVIVTVTMILFYRAVWATMALMFSLFGGTLWTFGVSYFAVGYLNANSAFLGSIVLGNGINFGIILLARYLEERRAGHGNTRAIQQSMIHTATATWTAAAAAGLSYGSLMLTGFRGFRQFGTIGLIGMLLCWLSAFTLLPAYLTLLDRVRPLVGSKSKKAQPYIWDKVARWVDRYARPIWIASLIVTLSSLALFTTFDSEKIQETNLAKLRNKKSMEQGSAYLSKHLDEIFNRYLSPLVILPKDRDSARRIADVLKHRKEEEGPRSLIASVQTLDDFIPIEQHEKLQTLQEIRKLLPPRLVARLSRDDQQKVQEILNTEKLQAVRQASLPSLVINKFTERDKSIGKMVLVEPPLSNATWDAKALFHFIHELREVTDAIEPGAPIAGSLPITTDLLEAVAHDGPRATLFALIAVVVLVIFLFRNVQTIALVLFALGLGVVWLAGVILAFKMKVNFFNFIALPITFGIGVDYGVNVFQRYREDGGNIIGVIRNTGGAVALCSFSTITGYTSLLLAGNQGFVSFGRLAVAGEVTCVAAALISLPAYLVLRTRRKGAKGALA